MDSREVYFNNISFEFIKFLGLGGLIDVFM